MPAFRTKNQESAADRVEVNLSGPRDSIAIICKANVCLSHPPSFLTPFLIPAPPPCPQHRGIKALRGFMVIVLVGMSSSVQYLHRLQFQCTIKQSRLRSLARYLRPMRALSVKGHGAESSRRSSSVCGDERVSISGRRHAFWGVAGRLTSWRHLAGSSMRSSI